MSAASLDELPHILEKIHECWESLGRTPVSFQEPRDLSTRSGIVVNKDMKAGEALKEEDMGFAWLPVGVSVSDWDKVIGARVKESIGKNKPVNWENFENCMNRLVRLLSMYKN